MVKYFVAFLRRYYETPNEAFRLDCNLFADHLERQQEIEQFWLDSLGLPQTCLRKSTVTSTQSTAKRSVVTGFRTELSAFVCTPPRSSRASTERSRNTAASSGRSGSDDGGGEARR
jgi:hypothetical protein